jgi:hypothetical protein
MKIEMKSEEIARIRIQGNSPKKDHGETSGF